jgi:hypothetical protein
MTSSGDCVDATDTPVVVCDAGPLIHLDALDALDVLDQLRREFRLG